MKGLRATAWAGLLLLGLGSAATAGAGSEGDAIDDVLSVLRERGIIDEEQHAQIAAKNRTYQEENSSLLGRIEFSGDIRARFENFWYDDGVLDENRPDRTRTRYRFRLKGKARVNEYVDAIFRFSSGEIVDLGDGDARSSNRTLGRGSDFNRDPFFIDQAYIQLKAPGEWVGENGKLHAMVGKTANPFRWKATKDFMLWDSDISTEGAGVQFEREINANLRGFANAGYFIASERSTGSDPHVMGLQLGALGNVSEDVELGGRISYYEWRSLDTAFLARGAAFGNVPSANRSRFSVVELSAYARYTGIERWPVLLFGHYARNFNALDTPGTGKEDLGWMLGAEVGDKKELVKIGAGYTWQEANYWPAQFTDSDYLDGRTNRKGWIAYVSREVLADTDLNVTLFQSEPIRESVPVFGSSVNLAKRIRLQADLVVKF